MQNQLEIAIIQSKLVWENPKKNRENFDQKINSLDNNLDLIVLPEMFTSGFTMQVEHVAETMDGQTVNWMLQKAGEKKSLVIGSLIIREKEKFYNRFIIAFPNGKIIYYDKRHLFSFAGEDQVFEAGREKLVFEYKGFKICPLICYDLRFPVWSRNTEEIDLLIYVANWPNARMLAWDTLLRARAIENVCYVIGLNRVGEDDNNLIYEGHSAVYNTLGETVLNSENKKEDIKFIRLDKIHISQIQDKFRFLDDKDTFEFTR
jgi:predicted amidohydrolase